MEEGFGQDRMTGRSTVGGAGWGAQRGMRSKRRKAGTSRAVCREQEKPGLAVRWGGVRTSSQLTAGRGGGR